ncbi:MAG TPA: biopolymer transporter ExbD [Myxococcales bacterium LLY-WYZ-16_1]|nr:biopolymer transporter ExbD [Myxococcales bacterium LLY-WYZ-16_1]
MARRKVFQTGSDGGAQIEMAPLIDMVFILLIFFMVASSFVREAGVEITRPESRTAQSLEDEFVPVAVDRQGLVHVAGRTIPPDSVRGIRAVLDETGRRRVLVQADRKVPAQLLIQVLDSAKLAGATQVDVAVEREGS